MTYRNKYRLARFGTIVAILVAVRGLLLVRDEALGQTNTLPGMCMLFGAVIFGIAATIAYHYYKVRKDDSKTQQQIAVETLADLAEKQQTNTVKSRKPVKK